MDALLVVSCFLAVLGSIRLVRRVMEADRNADARRAIRILMAEGEYSNAQQKLVLWQRARPFLTVGQSAYARSLAERMIDSSATMLTYGEMDPAVIRGLIRSLRRTPPCNPTARDNRPGSFFLRRDYGR